MQLDGRGYSVVVVLFVLGGLLYQAQGSSFVATLVVPPLVGLLRQSQQRR